MKERKLNNNKATKTVMSIVRTADVLNRYLEIELAKHGSSTARFAVMNALVAHGGTMTPTAISKWIFRAKHSITRLLHFFESIGFIRREPSRRDGRSVHITVTEKGWEATERMTPIAEDLSQKAISCFDDKQLEILMNLLRHFRKHLFKQINNTST